MTQALAALCLAVASICRPDAVLTNVADLADAVSTDVRTERPFEISADVIYRLEHDIGVMLLLADGERHVIAHYDPVKYDLRCRAGDRIRCSGSILHFTRVDFGRPILTNATVLGRIAVPDFPERRISSILNGECDWSPAWISGTVRSAVQSETSPNWAYLILNGPDGGIYLSAPKGEIPMSQFEGLVGRRIRAKGFAVPFDGSTRHYQGRIFQCSGFENLQTVDNLPDDPFEAPDISEIRNRHPAAIAALGMHRAHGAVLAAWQPGNILLSTTNGQILHVRSRDAVLPHAGQDIAVVGLPESNLFHINLAHAQWRLTGKAPAPPPPVRRATAADILRPKGSAAIDVNWHGRRIRLTGIVRGNPESVRDSRTLSLENGSDIIEVNFGAASPVVPPSGSTVEVTGTCVMDIPSWRSSIDFPQISGFTLVLDERDGLRILATPSWWTPRTLLTVIGALLAALAVCVLWNFSLRRIAERKGRELLREQIKSVQSKLQIAERTRLSVELHDSLAQSLSGVALELETARALEAADKDAHLDIAAQALKSCRGELRNCLWDLRSAALDEPDMTKAILRTLQPQVNDARLQVRFNVPRKRLSDTTAHAILRIVRELVINALRHGHAQSVRVAGGLDAEQLMFSVRDDGSGFDPGSHPDISTGHFGLQGIRERVAQLGGSVKIDSAPGCGTKVVVALPANVLSKE